ncbi:hypothetical protein LBMAG56_41450 [Verrucomicrobiota bacterium]|nr:hypothetical protein LBMAG56_41450 [Verrucomicrobiota bacterium]
MKSQAPQVSDTPLPVAFFLRKFNVSRTTFWRWETKHGLPVLQVGSKKFCRESDFIRFLEAGGKAQPEEHVQ